MEVLCGGECGVMAWTKPCVCDCFKEDKEGKTQLECGMNSEGK